ncbi:uncharacterized protein LOC127003470 [Eriocheir sinensis]|uniref:uncharacterized protein LOC127003470 n=1 Tax=Eriocheir sinensis TaxID=95602 RepID=UPI0021C742C6|nr:uncharacterized protein LOC127003470 [Eriocheir sinensis]
MARTLHVRGVLRQIRDVLVVTSAQNSFLPSSLPSLSPSIHFNSCRHLHLASRKSCHRSLVTSIPLLPSPSLHPFLLSSHTVSPLAFKIPSAHISTSPIASKILSAHTSFSPIASKIPSAHISTSPIASKILSAHTSFSPIASKIPSAHISTSPLAFKIRSKIDGEDLNKKKKKEYVTSFITVIDTEDKVSKMGLHQAEKLAKRRDLKLVKVEDPNLTKGSKDVYRLLTGKQFFEEQIKSKKSEKKSAVGTKDEKILAIGGNISQHDLAIKLHSVTKWLSKGHQVKVSIAAKRSSKEDMEKVFSTIEEEIKQHKGRIMQRHEKLDDIRFYIAPPVLKEEDKEAAQEGHQAPDKESRSDEAK